MINLKVLALAASSTVAFSCAHRLPAPPGTETSVSQSLNQKVLEYKVQEGETLLKVGKQYAVAPSSIQKLNRLSASEELKPGQLIYIPVSEAALEPSDLEGRGRWVERPDGEQDEDLPETGRRAFLYAQYRQLEFPVANGRVQSHFGPRSGRSHEGIDIFPRGDKTIVSAQSGTVEFVGRKRGYGQTVVINHKNFKTLYAHCAKIFVKKGETVKMGEKIALVGATGNAHGAHLHFEYQNMNNIAMDPLPHLDRDFAH